MRLAEVDFVRPDVEHERRHGDGEEQLEEHGSFRSETASHTRTIITSVALMRAAAVWPLRSCISRAASEVMMEVMRWPSISRTTLASRPEILTSTIWPTS